MRGGVSSQLDEHMRIAEPEQSEYPAHATMSATNQCSSLPLIVVSHCHFVMMQKSGEREVRAFRSGSLLIDWLVGEYELLSPASGDGGVFSIQCKLLLLRNVKRQGNAIHGGMASGRPSAGSRDRRKRAEKEVDRPEYQACTWQVWPRTDSCCTLREVSGADSFPQQCGYLLRL